MFVSHSKDKPGIICEDCYRSLFYGSDSYAKAYKHCVLREAVTPDIGRKICHCKNVEHFDGKGSPINLFPLKDDKQQHLDVNGIGSIQCSLLKLGESVAFAKYKGLQTVLGVESPSSKSRDILKISSKDRKTKEGGPMKTVTGVSVHNPKNREAVSSTTSVATDAAADRDIPLFFRKYAEKYPFGNVHMALRVGPLVIENGVSQYVFPILVYEQICYLMFKD